MRQKKEINVELGQNIRIVRDEACMTQEQFAEAIDVSPQYISDLERGLVGVSVTTLKRICTVLGVSSDRILFGDGNMYSLAAIEEKCHILNGEQISILTEIVDKYVEAIRCERFQDHA